MGGASAIAESGLHFALAGPHSCSFPFPLSPGTSLQLSRLNLQPWLFGPVEPGAQVKALTPPPPREQGLSSSENPWLEHGALRSAGVQVCEGTRPSKNPC